MWQGASRACSRADGRQLYSCSAQAQRTYVLRRGVLWPRGAACTASSDAARVAGSSRCGIAWLCLMSGLQRRTCAARRRYRVPWRGSMPCAVGDAQPAGAAAGRHAYGGPPRCGRLALARRACVPRRGTGWPSGAARPVSGSVASVGRRAVCASHATRRRTAIGGSGGPLQACVARNVARDCAVRRTQPLKAAQAGR